MLVSNCAAVRNPAVECWRCRLKKTSMYPDSGKVSLDAHGGLSRDAQARAQAQLLAWRDPTPGHGTPRPVEDRSQIVTVDREPRRTLDFQPGRNPMSLMVHTILAVGYMISRGLAKSGVVAIPTGTTTAAVATTVDSLRSTQLGPAVARLLR